MRDGGVVVERVGEIPAVGDERADDAEDLADARRHGPIGIGLEGFGRGGGGVAHERNKNIERGCCARTFFLAENFSWTRRRGVAHGAGGGPRRTTAVRLNFM